MQVLLLVLLGFNLDRLLLLLLTQELLLLDIIENHLFLIVILFMN